MAQKCNELALGYSIGILGGIAMLILWIIGKLGLAAEAVSIMEAYHIWFSLSIGGLIAGIVEAAVFGFVTGYLLAYIYNKFS